MPKLPKPANSKKVETLKHEEAKRKNIPTAEYQSVMAEVKIWAWFKKGSFKVTVARQIRPSLRGGSESTGWVELSGSEELEP